MQNPTGGRTTPTLRARQAGQARRTSVPDTCRSESPAPMSDKSSVVPVPPPPPPSHFLTDFCSTKVWSGMQERLLGFRRCAPQVGHATLGWRGSGGDSSFYTPRFTEESWGHGRTRHSNTALGARPILGNSLGTRRRYRHAGVRVAATSAAHHPGGGAAAGYGATGCSGLGLGRVTGHGGGGLELGAQRSTAAGVESAHPVYWAGVGLGAGGGAVPALRSTGARVLLLAWALAESGPTTAGGSTDGTRGEQ
jgi:hypothetical protein